LQLDAVTGQDERAALGRRAAQAFPLCAVAVRKTREIDGWKSDRRRL